MLALLHIDRCGNGGDGRRGITHRCELGHEDLAVKLIPYVACEPHRKPCLADSPWTRKSDQSIASQPVREQPELIGTTNQPRGLGRELSRH